MPFPEENRLYTYADYRERSEGERWELIGGVPYMMSPTPSSVHQSVSAELTRQFANFLKGKTCKIFAAPFDVRLSVQDYGDTVVQPDLAVVCDGSKIDENGCDGAPDLAVEILSPSTSYHDRVRKFNLYLKAGVKEYWIVDPETRTVQVCVLQSGLYVVHMYEDAGDLPVRVLEGLSINFREVFAE